MSHRNRSRSGAQAKCPHCGKKLRGQKGLKAHIRDEHGPQPVKADQPQKGPGE